MRSVLLKICAANFFLVAAVMMQLAAVLAYGRSVNGNMESIALALVAFVAGIIALGPVNAYIIDQHNHKKVYYLSLFAIVALTFVLYFSHDTAAVALVRFAEGAFFGLAQVTLGSTMLNDLTTSNKRTLSDYSFAWSALLAVPIGVAAAYYSAKYASMPEMMLACMVLTVISMLIMTQISVPFRAPIKVKVFSCDRFWQSSDILPFINLLLFSTIMGLLVGMVTDADLFLFAAIGIAITHPMRIFVFRDADVRAEIVSSMLLVLAGLLIPFGSTALTSMRAAAVMIGAGMGLTSSRFLLYFIKLIGHCQRGTAQNTYMLSRESGYAIGFVAAYLISMPLAAAIVLNILSLAFYLLATHPWFKKHSDRDFKYREV